MQTTQASRRSFLTFLGLGGTTAALACVKPVPGSDASVTPGSVMGIIATVMDVLNVVLPILTPFFTRFVSGPGLRAVLTAADIVQRAGADWQAVASAYQSRGGDTCRLYAATGALTEGLIRLARELVNSGVGWGAEIEGLINDTALLTDRLIGRCTPENIDGGMLAVSGRSGDAAYAILEQLRDASRVRGVPLRALPPIRPESL